MILACKKKLGKQTKKKWVWVRPPPLVWEKFPRKVVFFSEDVPNLKFLGGTNKNKHPISGMDGAALFSAGRGKEKNLWGGAGRGKDKNLRGGAGQKSA